MTTRVSTRPAVVDPHGPTDRRAGRTDQIVCCRYLRRTPFGQCTAESATGPDAEITLCTHHLARTLELLNRSLPGYFEARGL